MAKPTRIPRGLVTLPPRIWLMFVARVRFGDVISQLPAALDKADPEGIHDIRVSIRRLRDVLRDLRHEPEQNDLRKVDRSLKHLARELGAVRDIDVACQTLDKLSLAANDPAVCVGLSRMSRELRERREIAFREASHLLTGDSLESIRKRFDDIFEDSRSMGDLPATGSIGQIGREIIADRLDRFESLSDSIYHPFALKELHQLRIAGKHVRYSIELFAEAFGPQISPFAEQVAQMQDHLGQVHDCDVWIAALGRRLTGTKREPPDIGRQRPAATWLLAEFTQQRTSAYQSALSLWTEWESIGLLKDLRNQLCEPAFLASSASLSPVDR